MQQIGSTFISQSLMDVRNQVDSLLLKWYRVAVKQLTEELGLGRAGNRAALRFQGMGVNRVFPG